MIPQYDPTKNKVTFTIFVHKATVSISTCFCYLLKIVLVFVYGKRRNYILVLHEELLILQNGVKLFKSSSSFLCPQTLQNRVD